MPPRVTSSPRRLVAAAAHPARSRRRGPLRGALVQQYTGASQTQIGIACVMPQGKVSAIINGIQQVEKLEVFDRIADGLGLPDPARISLGLAPRRPGSPRALPTAPQVPSASSLFTLDE